MIAIHQLTFPRQQRVRILNALHDAYVTTAEEVAAKTERWWLMRRNMGRACVASLKAALAEVGLSFAESGDKLVLDAEEGALVARRLLERCSDPLGAIRRVAVAVTPKEARPETARLIREILLEHGEDARVEILADVDVCPKCGGDERRDGRTALGRCQCDNDE